MTSYKLSLVLTYELLDSQDQLQPIDCRVWATCMISESKHCSELCPGFFKRILRRIMNSRLYLRENDITHNNCRNIYENLVSHAIEDT